jgi:hypothetical protein
VKWNSDVLQLDDRKFEATVMRNDVDAMCHIKTVIRPYCSTMSHGRPSWIRVEYQRSEDERYLGIENGRPTPEMGERRRFPPDLVTQFRSEPPTY